MNELTEMLTTHLDALLTDTRAIVVALIAAYAVDCVGSGSGSLYVSMISE
jgi:hypothetical protein